MAASALRLEPVEGADEFHRLRGAWSDLLEAAEEPSPFLTWEWLFPWWRHLGGRRRLFLATIRRGGDLVALAPWCLAPPSPRLLLPFRRVEFLGTGHAGSDYLNLIIRPDLVEEVIDLLHAELVRRRTVLHLSALAANALHVRRLAARLQQSGWRLEGSTMGICPQVDLPGSWDDFLAICSRSHREAIRRKERKLHAGFRVELNVVASEAERGPALERLIHMHMQCRDGRGGSNAFHTAALRRFHHEASRLALGAGALCLLELLLDGRPAASLYGLWRRNVLHYYQSGFNTSYRSWGVGAVLMGLSIRHAIERGARRFDFLHGDEAYKFHWASRWHQLQRLELYPPHTWGDIRRRAAAAGRATRAVARRVVGTMW